MYQKFFQNYLVYQIIICNLASGINQTHTHYGKRSNLRKGINTGSRL